MTGACRPVAVAQTAAHTTDPVLGYEPELDSNGYLRGVDAPDPVGDGADAEGGIARGHALSCWLKALFRHGGDGEFLNCRSQAARLTRAGLILV